MAEPSTQPWDLQCDVLVVGSGGGALAGALLAARAGLRVVLIEKTDRYGGTTTYSGGALWIPLSAPIERAGVNDSPVRVEEYLTPASDSIAASCATPTWPPVPA
jgi:succinate dehydrogenase/fumarate reductase flavoprotein subunit